MPLNLPLDTISLSIYSFGYGAGFIRDDRAPARVPMTLDDVCELAISHGLGGVEFPIDRYAPTASSGEIDAIIRTVTSRGLQARLDMETFDPAYLRSLIPLVAEHGLGFVRIKVSDFYGGNRYCHPEFAGDFQRVVAGIKDLAPMLDHHGVRLLIENHQDIMLNDYEQLWLEFDKQLVGVNWDIGNSLPACETPSGFLAKTGQAIGNVHLKDYQLTTCETGYRMVRCALGKGMIDFPDIFKVLSSSLPNVPLTIELGALNTRTADINRDEYWTAVPGKTSDEISQFRAFIAANSKSTDGLQTAWEQRQSPDAIIATELAEVSESVDYLRQL